ncbi:MAG: tetratricopeptide repeat protein, partial [Myxococcota bacterium]
MPRRLALPSAVVALVAVAGAPALGGGFLSDDHHVVERGQLIGAWRNLPVIWSHDAMWNSDLGAFAKTSPLDTYRPVTMTTFVLDHAIWGKRPLGYHLTSLLLHLGCVALLCVFARRAAGEAAAASAALLLGLHPVASEAWVWINGRSDLLATLLVLAALLALERGEGAAPRPTGRGASPREAGRPRPSAVATAALLALGACLAKETAVVAVALLALRPRWPAEAGDVPALRLRRPAALAALGAAGALYLVLRALALGGMRVAGSGAHVGAALRALPAVLGIGALDLALPRHAAPRFLAEDVAALGTVGATAIAVAITAAAILLWRARRRAPLLAWAAAAYLACVAPGALTVSFRWQGQGRYFYLPLALIAVPLAHAATRAARGRRPWLAVAVAYALLLVVQLQSSIAAMRDDDAAAQAALEEFPDRSHGWEGVSRLRCGAGRQADGLRLLERAYAIAPHDARRLHNLAVCAFRSGEHARALALNLAGQREFPGDANFRHGATLARVKLGDGLGAI